MKNDGVIYQTITNIEDGEYWWGGSTDDGKSQPFDKTTVFIKNLFTDAPNQTMPFYASSHGRYIFSHKPFEIEFNNGKITTKGSCVIVSKCGDSLKSAYAGAAAEYFPFRGNSLPEDFFLHPQYNTWMQFTYNPTQEGVLEYAENVIKHGFTPGVFIIDEGWHGRYGLWEFDKLKFPDPKGMIDKLHKMGFKVMLWVVPYYTPDGKGFVDDNSEYTRKIRGITYNCKHFLRNAAGDYAVCHWWNGYSFALDLTDENDFKLLDGKLHKLMNDYGVDGFKFDGGDIGGYLATNFINGPMPPHYSPVEQNRAWNDFGLRYKYHEYKDTFNGAGKICIQRLRDRAHEWYELKELIGCGALAGLIGEPFICPDMIGGGSWVYKDYLKDKFDPELFVRMAQASALFPMMQFSWAPWDVLTDEEVCYCKSAADLHVSFGKYITDLVKNSCVTGKPILRLMEYEFPHCGYEKINDQFMLGSSVLVAPVLDKGVGERKVIIPEGEWLLHGKGQPYVKGEYNVAAPLSDLIWFMKK